MSGFDIGSENSLTLRDQNNACPCIAHVGQKATPVLFLHPPATNNSVCPRLPSVARCHKAAISRET